MTFTDPFLRAELGVTFTGAWLSGRFNAFLKPFGLSDQQFNVLRILRGQKGKPATLQLIQERMVHRMSNATRLVEKLRLKGLVTREICPTNRRKVEICITKKGKKLLETIDHEQNRKKSEMETNLTAEEAKMLGELLDKVRN